MRKYLTLVAASTAISAVMGLPALSAMQAPAGNDSKSFAAESEVKPDAMPLVLVSGDDEDDDKNFGRFRRHGDDEDDDDDDCDEDEEDDGDCNSARIPAPVGPLAPPQNGLFDTNTLPKVLVN